MSVNDQIYARVIAHSVSPEGVELISVEKRHHRFILAEDNTHATPAKNSASMRARSAKKVLDEFIEMIKERTCVPVEWTSEQRGMSGGDNLTEEQRIDAESQWVESARLTAHTARKLIDIGVHKSLVNRLLEPYVMHTSVWTGTAFDNYFAQRCHPDAQPEIRVVAEKMRDAIAASTPTPLCEGQFHLPYVRDEDRLEVTDERELAKISAARVARTSYLTQDGRRDLDKDFELYDRLAYHDPGHWSPLEQVATPCLWNRQSGVLDLTAIGGTASYPLDHLPKLGKFTGWISMRHMIEAERGIITFR